MTRDGWVQYAQYARKLDSVRAEELARTAGIRAGAAEMSEHADGLEGRLRGQNGQLTSLAATLRLRRTKITPIEPVPEEAGFIEPQTGLRRVAQLLDAADEQALMAQARGHRATLLPKMSSTVRSLAVYGSAALVVLVLQLLAFRHSGDDTNPILVLFVIPALGFAVAYVVLAVGSRTRVAQDPVAARTRLGFLLCFGIGPIAAVIEIAASVQSK